MSKIVRKVKLTEEDKTALVEGAEAAAKPRRGRPRKGHEFVLYVRVTRDLFDQVEGFRVKREEELELNVTQSDAVRMLIKSGLAHVAAEDA